MENSKRDRRGFGVLIATIFMLLAVLGVSVNTAARRGGLAAEAQAIAEGRRALEIGRSCLAEALLDFKASCNRPGTKWYDALRGAKTSATGMQSWLVAEFQPKTTLATLAGESVQIAPVRVSVWRDAAVDAGGTGDEKFALLTLTADVGVTPGGVNPFRGVVRRQLQRSFHLKQTRVVAPQPFGRWTLYVHLAPQLARQKDAYARQITDFGARRNTIEKAYRGEIDEVIATLKSHLAWMVLKVADWDKAREEIAKARKEREKLAAITAMTLGLVSPALVKLDEAIEKMEKDLADDIAKVLAAFSLPDEATFRQVAANPYAPENLKRDIGFELERGSWPAFRGYQASPEGLLGGGDNLEMPVVVEREKVATRELDYRVPAPPALPVRPTYSVQTKDIAWTGQYATITREFVRYRTEYQARLREWLTAVGAEFARHEELFRLLPAVPAEHARYLGDLKYQSARASYVFESQDAFLKHVVGADGVARLDGVYAVKGELTRFPARYEGRGFIAVEKEIALGALTRPDARSTAVFFSGADVKLTGNPDAVVMAPAGRVTTTGAGTTVRQAVVAQVTAQDDFTAEAAPELGDAGPAGLWVNVAPAPLAEALLRQ